MCQTDGRYWSNNVLRANGKKVFMYWLIHVIFCFKRNLKGHHRETILHRSLTFMGGLYSEALTALVQHQRFKNAHIANRFGR